MPILEKQKAIPPQINLALNYLKKSLFKKFKEILK